jgi:hypothetical protein
MKPPEKMPELSIEARRDLAMHMKEICRRLNANPEIAKLLLVNPIYVLEDLGVRLNQEMRDHVHNTFHNPPAKQRRLVELETELKAELEQITGKPEIPVSPEHRAELLFQHLKLTPLAPEATQPARLEPGRLRAYGSQHPLLARLLEYDAVRKGGLTFHPRETYEAYKRGARKQCWLDSITFKV